MTQTLKVETTRLERGEGVVISNRPYKVLSVERLFHYLVYGTADLPVGATDVAVNIFNLRPEQGELYNIDTLGIDGMGRMRLEFPSGAQRNTPHNVAEYYDQVIAPRAGNPNYAAGRVYFWCEPDRYPVSRVSNPMAVAIKTVLYFYGWKYNVVIVTAPEIEDMKLRGVRVLEATSYYEKI